MTAHAVITPRCPIFFAMTKQLLVVALPSMTRMAMSFSSRNPSQMATGRNSMQNKNSLKKEMPSVSLSFPLALPN